MRLPTILLLVAAAGAPTSVTARSPQLKILPAPAEPLNPGITRIANVGYAYLPPSTERPPPLLLLFHGAGMEAGAFLGGMKAEADRCGCAMLAIQSAGRTWDLVGAARPGVKGETLFGVDADRVEAGLARILSAASIDRARIVPVGFSDGASYALSLGLFNPGLFRSVVAIAPGFVIQPALIDPGQRIAIAHGRLDRVLSFASTEANIVSPLRNAGYRLAFLPFAGGHLMHRPSLQAGLEYALQSSP